MADPFADLDYVVVSDSAEGTLGAFQTEDMANLFAKHLSNILLSGDEFTVTLVSDLTN